jgi:hypothetical protein
MILQPHTRIPHGREVSEGRRKKNTREKERERERESGYGVCEETRESEREREYSCMGRLLNNNIPQAKTY